MAINLVDPPGGDIDFPRVLWGQTVPVIEQTIQNQLVHAHRCPNCSEPVCIYVKKHQVHQVTCEVKNCLPCTRYHHWMVMHTSNCAGKCLMKECPQLKEFYRSKKLEEIRSLFPADLMDPVLPEVQDLSVEDYAIVRRSYPDPRQAQSLSHVLPWLKTSTLLHARSTLTSRYSSMASSSREQPELSEIEPDMITLKEMQTAKHPHTTSGVKVKGVKYPKSLDPTPSSGGSSDPPRRDPGPDHGHESHLLEQCWIPFGMQTLHITQNGGEFLLEPATPEHSDVDNRAFRMEVPATAISSESLEVRYGIILDGPFALPSGYRLASPVVYVWFDHSKVTKSLKLHIPHWIAGDHGHLEEDVSFVISPHVLPEGEHMYTFTAMEPECTSFYDTFGTVKLSGHCSLLGLAMREKTPSSYCASAWEKVEGSNRLLRVVIIYNIPYWLKVLNKYWKHWRRCFKHCVTFKFKKQVITGQLSESRGKCWSAYLVSPQIGKADVCYGTHNTEKKMKVAVEEGVYPPSFLVDVTQNNCHSNCRALCTVTKLIIEGIVGENLCYSVKAEDVIEEVPVPPGVETQELAGINREESVSPEWETNNYQNKIPSDVGLQGVLNKVPVWYSLATSLGVSIKQVEAWESKPLGGLLALGYWRDGKSGDLFPPTWGFLLQTLAACHGSTVADALEKEAQHNPAWSNT